jgi:uncharacterized protein
VTGAVAARLPGGRLHLRHGPIDLVCWAAGEAAAAALDAATVAFGPVLETLVAERALLRAAAGAAPAPVNGPVARRMVAAVHPYRARFITPMAAVAGAVADHVLAAMRAAGPLTSAYVNNGGDIALHLAPGESLTVGLVRDLALGRPEGAVTIRHTMGVGGVATSGWPGRSFSLGIADAVTVLARDAAEADAAATVIANAVDAEHPAIRRAPAVALDPDSDLGERLVTTAVGALPAEVVASALQAGATEAAALQRAGLIVAALLFCQGRSVTPTGIVPAPHPPPAIPASCRSSGSGHPR